jgi:hypothetical protein
MQKRVAHFSKSLTRRDMRLDYAWHIEPNPAPPGHHIHMWAHGADTSQSVIAAAAVAAGMGTVIDIRSVKPAEDSRVRTLAYGMKSCEPPDGTVSELWPEAKQYRTANGGRLVHVTRNFWRDQLGRPLTRIRDAIRLARQAQGRGEWVLVN